MTTNKAEHISDILGYRGPSLEATLPPLDRAHGFRRGCPNPPDSIQTFVRPQAAVQSAGSAIDEVKDLAVDPIGR